jgi:putative phosphoesterase
MKIGVLSDSHGEVWAMERAIGILQDMGVTMAIHCGDIGPEVVPLLKGIRIHFVHGNMDNRDQLTEVMIQPEHTLHDQIGTLEIEGRRVAFLHGHDVKLLRHTIHSGCFDLVCHGHTHTFASEFEGKTLVLNPGALTRSSRPSIAVVDLTSMDVTEISL